MTPFAWNVHKFGGTSVGNAECMKKCIHIIAPLISQNRIAVVVSAMGGKPKVTDLLLETVHSSASGRTAEVIDKLASIRTKHIDCICSILKKDPESQQTIISLLDADLRDISDLLRAVHLMRIANDQVLELISGYGEIWSANIMAAAFRLEGLPFKFLNARDVLFVNEATKVDWSKSQLKLIEFINGMDLESFANGKPTAHLMITGFIASTIDGIATTLKRDGSDYSASIFGKMLSSSSITIWTDVNGVYSADPRRVPEAQVITEVSYSEAIELAYFGAKVIHPKTMEPAIECKIPIYIRNTFEPEHEGTRIYLPPSFTASYTTTSALGCSSSVRERSVCGFTTIDGISLLNLEGTGMLGVPGIANRLFGALSAASISVMFIAQASSEHSICFATRSAYADRARHAIQEAFYYELKQGLITAIRIISDGCSIIAAVGERMCQTSGVAGIFFGALGAASINILSIAQGCDERNISAVVYTRDATKALRAVHAAFWLSSIELSIGIVGVSGRVGTALLQSLLQNLSMLEDRLGLSIKIRGVANSRNMLLADDLKDDSMRGLLSACFQSKSLHTSRNHNSIATTSTATKKDSDSNSSSDHLIINGKIIDTDLEVFLKHMKSASTPHTIIIDTTNSFDVASLHPYWLHSRAHVVTANKRALVSDISLYNNLHTEMRATHHMYMSEVTIGASLPIRTTLSDILCSGDAVHSIEGLMSVSAANIITGICNHGLSFTEALQRTYQQGLFEDDVFADLEGIESAEKLMLLAREMGYPLQLADIDIEPLATRRQIACWNTPLSNEFAQEDAIMKARVQAATQRGCTLRYVQRLICHPPAALGSNTRRKNTSAINEIVTASVRLEEVPLGSAMHEMMLLSTAVSDVELSSGVGASSLPLLLQPPVYHFAFYTERYSQSPLIVQGPLSDAANTASGIIGDILRIARSVGAKDKGGGPIMTL